MSVQITRACPKDSADLWVLVLEHATFERSSATCTASALRDALAGPSPMLKAWKATDEHGEIVGYATATRDFATWACEPFLHLDCLFVREAYRGGRVGARLLSAVKDFAIDEGLSQIQWQTPDWNLDAERFYLRHGATVLTKRRFCLRIGPQS